ncbi:hypothetical protein Tco_0140385 [Tanacetum coccineum]
MGGVPWILGNIRGVKNSSSFTYTFAFFETSGGSFGFFSIKFDMEKIVSLMTLDQVNNVAEEYGIALAKLVESSLLAEYSSLVVKYHESIFACELEPVRARTLLAVTASFLVCAFLIFLEKIFSSDSQDKQSDEKPRHKNPNSQGWSQKAKIPSLASDVVDVKLPFVDFFDERIQVRSTF